MKKIFDWLRTALEGKWAVIVKLFTGRSFVVSFPLAVFLVMALFTQSFILWIATMIWLFPTILGIREED